MTFSTIAYDVRHDRMNWGMEKSLIAERILRPRCALFRAEFLKLDGLMLRTVIRHPVRSRDFLEQRKGE